MNSGTSFTGASEPTLGFVQSVLDGHICAFYSSVCLRRFFSFSRYLH